MGTTQQLPPILEAVLVRLGRTTDLNVTQAVKLPYLVDVIAMHILGRQITEGTHQAWDYGVVTSQIWHYLNKCDYSPIFHLVTLPWSEEKRLIIDITEPDPRLTPEERQIVDFVAKEYGHLSAVDLGRMTKFMNPTVSKWGSNRAADLGSEAYDRMSDDYQEMAKQAASLTLDQLRRVSYPAQDDAEESVA